MLNNRPRFDYCERLFSVFFKSFITAMLTLHVKKFYFYNLFLIRQIHAVFNKQHFYKQRQAEIGKTLSKS